MKIKLTLLRSDASTDDIVVSLDATATVGDIAAAIARSDPRSGLDRATLDSTRFSVQLYRPGLAQPDVLAASQPVDEAGLGSGMTVALVPAPEGARGGGTGRIELVATGGPDDGAVFSIGSDGGLIGRGSECIVQLTDTSASKKHARIDLVDGAVQLVDLNSANGLVVDGGVVPRITLQLGESVLIGETELTVSQVTEPRGVDGPTSRAGATVEFTRSPRVEARFPGEELPSPEPPAEQDPVPFPWLIMIAPMIMGGVLFAITGSILSIAFVALSPILMVSNWASGRATRKRRLKIAIERFDAQLEDLTARLTEGQVREGHARRREAPALAEVLAEAQGQGSLLWARRPEHWSFLNLRLGSATLRSRLTVGEISGREKALPEYVNRILATIDAHWWVPNVPVIENLFDSGALGVAGQRADVADTARGYLAQLLSTHAPTEVSVAAIVGPDWVPELSWLRWMPHTSSPQSPLGEAIHLADSATSGAALLSAIEALVASRAPVEKQNPIARGDFDDSDTRIVRAANVGRSENGPMPPDAETPALVLIISDDAPVDRGRLIQLAESAAEAGIYPVWLADAVGKLPAVCRTFVDLGAHPAARVGLVRAGQTIEGLVVDRLDVAGAEVFARSIAPVVDAAAVETDASDLPRSVSMLSLLGPELAESSEAILDRWRQNDSILDRTKTPSGRHKPGKLRALVGQAGADAMHLDLRLQGPHALVGGTTGSGKSEFLQSWVLGMAAEYSPDRVTFLFVDYKGGSAFADCVNLPHCVGLVTDLSQHLVRRALTSLRAELTHREHLFNRKKAKDILDLEKRKDPETPPALVIVIDEFAALVNDVPDFVDGVVDVAQRGRSLGIHLIMATQRPAGVIKDNLRANTNLRIALRMADEMDSSDVLGTPMAAMFDPSIPGRAAVKSGHGRVAPFQSGYAGGWTNDEPVAAQVGIEELRYGTPVRWFDPAEEEAASRVEEDPGPTDQARLVSTVIKAHATARIPDPRRPWMPELAKVFDLAELRQRTDAELAIGVADVPEQQRQSAVYFHPDDDGHLLVYGTGGAGKSVLLRTIGVAAGITPKGGPTEVYGLDFGSGALKMLEELPHVGSVISGDDSERIGRLLRYLRSELERRSLAYSAVDAGSIAEYRRIAKRPDERRIIVLVDNFPAFRTEYEVGSARAPLYAAFQQLLSDGRMMGIHFVLTADRSASVPSSVGSYVPRRVILRLADENAYAMFGAPNDILGPESPPGRAIIDGVEVQVAVLGGSPSVVDQARAVRELAQSMERSGVAGVPAIASLSSEIDPRNLPVSVDGQPVLGISDETLGPVGFDPTGTFVISGPPGSGRTSTLQWVVRATLAVEPDARLVFFGTKRSGLAEAVPWSDAATTLDDVVELAKTLKDVVVDETSTSKVVIAIESISDYLSTPADSVLVELIKAVKRTDHLVIAESETSTWGSSWPLLGELKAGRRGIVLQPESIDGDSILRTSIPRSTRSDFPLGRGFSIVGGRATLVQVPNVDLGMGESSPSTHKDGSP